MERQVYYRKLSKDGKITIPKKLRDELGWKAGTKLLLRLKDEQIIITEFRRK